MKREPMTVRGAQMLRDELKRLKTVDRPRIIKAIAEAREHGDLKENAEYHAAREQQSFAEGRVNEIENKLGNAEIIDVTKLGAGSKVVFGATVVVVDVDDDAGAELSYRIVGPDEADIKAGLVSYTSPIARALIGHEEGDEVTVQAPAGETVYEVVEVAYK